LIRNISHSPHLECIFFKNNEELATQIWDAFGELYKAIKKVDDELVLAIYRKETEPIEAPVSLLYIKDLSAEDSNVFSIKDLLVEDSNAVLILEKLWSKMKSIMEQAINKMESNSQWHDLLENLIEDGERISSELLSLLKKNV
jgi:ribosomal protein S3AE